MKFTPAHMNSVLVEMWHFFNNNQPLSSLMPLKKRKLLPLAPPDQDTNTQACLTATQTLSRKKYEEIKEIDRASTASGEVEATRTTGPMVVLREKGGLSRNLLI